LAALAFIIGLGPARAADAPRAEQPVRDIEAPVRLVHVQNLGGDILVETWTEGYIRILAARRDGAAVDPAADVLDQPGDAGEIDVWTRPELAGEAAVDLRLLVPPSVQVAARSRAGTITVRGVGRGVSAETDSGDIRCGLPAGTDADVSLRSLTGMVEARLPLEFFGTPQQGLLDGRLGRGGVPVLARTRAGRVTLFADDPARLGRQAEAAPAGAPAGPAPGPAAAEPVVGDASSAAPAMSPAAGGYRLSVSTRLVTLNVQAADAAGAAVKDLTREDFKVLDNGAEQAIVYFEPQTAPLNLLLLLDLSGSTKEKTKVIKRAAARFVDMLNPADRVAVAAFTSRYMLVSGFTENRRLTRERIDDIKNRGGGTAFYEAMWYALDEMAGAKGRRNVIVVMSDGVDNVLQRPDDYTSKWSYDEMRGRVAAADVTVFPVYIDTEYEQVVKEGNTSSIVYRTARRQIAGLADSTGGRMFPVQRFEDLEDVYRTVAAELRNLYSLSYYAPAKTGTGREWHAVGVDVARPGVQARTRPGYFLE
jgi:VWFA-related protein